jgi:hypothetical protein
VFDFSKGFIDDLGGRSVKIRFNRLEGVLSTDLHHHSWVHILVDEQTLGKASTQVVTRDMPEIVISSLSSCCLCGSFHSGPNAASGEIDKRFAGGDVLGVCKLLEAALDLTGEVSIARLPSGSGRILTSRDTEPILAALGRLDMSRLYLWNLEGPQPDERPQLNDDVVSIPCGRSAEILDFIAKVYLFITRSGTPASTVGTQILEAMIDGETFASNLS